jgi:hypothetical protein
MGSNSTDKPILEDSPAWHKDAHTLGAQYYDKHVGDGGATSTQLMQFALSLFDPKDPESKNLRSLQYELCSRFGTRSEGKGPPVTQAMVDELNRWLMDTFKVVLSHAQMVCLWHLLVDQDDLRLLRPWAETKNW